MNRLLRLQCVMIALLCICACSKESNKVRYLEKGDQFYSEQKYREAIIEYKNVIQLEPSNATALRQLGFTYYAMGEYQNALPYLLKAKKASPDDPDIRIKTARIFVFAGKPHESRDELNYILEKDPRNLDAIILLAELAGNPQEVEDVLERLKAVDATPADYPKLNMALGKLYAQKGELLEAENHFLEALRGGPDIPEAHIGLGTISMAKKDYRQAEQEFKAAAELVPETSPVRLKLADFYVSMKNLDAARKILGAAVEKNPQFIPALYRLAIISLEEKKTDECARYLETILKANPSDSEGLFIRGRMCLAAGEPGKAITDFQTVVKARPQFALAHFFLGAACLKAGDTFQAKASLKEALKLDPALTEARLNLAGIAINAGAFDDAWAGLAGILEKEPDNFEALLMFAEAVQSREGIGDAQRRLKNVEAQFGRTARFQLAMGSLLLKSNSLTEAEGFFREALTIDPGALEAYWALGSMYLIKKEVKSAEREYRKASEAGHDKPAPQLKLAQFYIRTGDSDTAQNILADCVARFPDYLPAYHALAEIALERRNFEELTGLIDSTLQKNPADLVARILKGRMNLAQNRIPDALKDLWEAEKLHPGTAEVFYWIGIACLESGDVEGARTKFSETLDIDPLSADARIHLAEIDVKRGSYQLSINSLEGAFGTLPKPPEVLRVLGAAYLAKGDALKSAACFAELLNTHPYDLQGLYLLGVSLRRQGKNEEAVNYLEKASKAAPDFVDPVIELAGIYVSDKKTGQALDLVVKRLEASPANASLYLLLGTLRATGKEWKQAEEAFLKGIEIDPMLSPCYLELAKVYSATGRSDQALARLEEGIAKDPRNAGLQMLCATLYQQRHDVEQARKGYEKVIELDPNCVPALNNLAYIFAVDLSDCQEGVKLAQRARELAPDDPQVADTLGWVLYMAGNTEWSLSYIQQSALRLPENPEVQYHLGMAHYKLGNREAAKQALNKALELDPSLPVADEIKRVLAEI